MRWSLPLLILTASFAGCVDGVDGPGGASALASLPVAEATAQAWSDEAALVGVAGLETAEAGTVDGRPPDWTYVFAAPDKNHHHRVTVDAAGEVVDEKDRPLHELPHGGEEIAGWQVDADAALKVLRAEAPGFVVNQSDAVQWFLGQTDAGPTWAVAVGSDPAWRFYGVHAGTATLLDAEALEGFGDSGVNPAAGRFSERLTLAEPIRDHAFSIEEAHPMLTVTVHLTGLSAATNVNVVLTGPGGKQEQVDLESLPGGPDKEDVAVAAPANGTWTIDVELVSGAMQDYFITWCAEGTGKGAEGIPMGGGPNSGTGDRPDGSGAGSSCEFLTPRSA